MQFGGERIRENIRAPCVAFSRGLRMTLFFFKACKSCYRYEFLWLFTP